MRFNSNKLSQIRHQSGLSTRQFAEVLQTNNASISRFENGLSQPPAEFILRLARFACVDAEWFYELDPAEIEEFGLIKGKRQLGERLRQALQCIPISDDVLPLMIGSTAQELSRVAEQDLLDDSVLLLFARMSGFRIGWLKSGGGDKMLPNTLGGITYSRPVVGEIGADLPVLAQQHIVGWEPTTVENVAFFFKVEGNSMYNAGILNGDLVGVNLCHPLEDGKFKVKLCVLLITKPDKPDQRFFSLKFIHRDKVGNILAVSANPMCTPMLLDEQAEEVRILGVVGQMKRSYSP